MKIGINVSSWFGKFSSFFYAILYLSMIPAFAIIYYFLPHHFYHSTVQYEQALSVDAKYIQLALTNKLIQTFKKAHNGNIAAVRGWTLNSNSFYFRELKVIGDEINLKLVLILEKGSENDTKQIFLTPTIKFSPETRYSIRSQTDEESVDAKIITIEGLDLPQYDIGVPEKEDIAKAIFPSKKDLLT
jgi:hypothetical protein